MRKRKPQAELQGTLHMPREEETLCTLCAEHAEHARAAIQSRSHVEGREGSCLLCVGGVTGCQAQVWEEVEGCGHFEGTATATQLRTLVGRVPLSLSRMPCTSWLALFPPSPLLT